MRKILVTGATGFIGSFLMKELAKRNEKITFLARPSSNKRIIEDFKKLGMKAVIGDLRNKESLYAAIDGNDTIIHLAAIHDFGYNDLKKTNIKGTRNLLEVCYEKGVKRFIHMSSATVFGPIKNGTEESRCNPGSGYAKTKYLGEKIVEEYQRKGMDTTILRPPIVYGNHRRASMYQWSKYIKKGYFLIFGSGKNNVEIVHVDDVVRSVLLTLNNKKSKNQIYIITSTTTTMNELVSYLAGFLGVKKPKHIPLWLAYALSVAITCLCRVIGKKSPLTMTNIKNMSRNRNYVSKKAENELGYKAEVELKKGLEKSIEWYRINGYF